MVGVGSTTNANIFIVDNVCRTNGGTVFWFRDPPKSFAVRSVAYVQVFFFLFPHNIIIVQIHRPLMSRFYEYYMLPHIINHPWWY